MGQALGGERVELGRGEDWEVLEMSWAGLGRVRGPWGWRAPAG